MRTPDVLRFGNLVEEPETTRLVSGVMNTTKPQMTTTDHRSFTTEGGVQTAHPFHKCALVNEKTRRSLQKRGENRFFGRVCASFMGVWSALLGAVTVRAAFNVSGPWFEEIILLLQIDLD